LSEQELIKKYFSKHQATTESVELSVGDDTAIVNTHENTRLAITTDTLNVGVHFYPECNAEFVGHKSLAVSLSDIAAMGATPLWATISLSIPEVDHLWLKKFSHGLYQLADKHKVRVIGGDLVKGPLSITVQVVGNLTKNKRMLRSACALGDLIYVSGYIGDAALGLKLLQDSLKLNNANNHEYFVSRLQTPMPRLDISDFVVNYSQAAIDISDGFLIDLQRMLDMSCMAAEIQLENIPISDAMQLEVNKSDDVKELLMGGEDYELIFTIAKEHKNKIESYFNAENILISEVGSITEGSGVSLTLHGKAVELPKTPGFDHFT